MIRRSPSFTVLCLLAWSFRAANLASASSLVPTELEGVDGAKASVYVSTYLPVDREPLQTQIETLVADRFAEYGLLVQTSGDAYFEVVVSGNELHDPKCDDLVLFEINAKYSEPVQLKRDPSIKSAHSAVIWGESMVDVVTEHDLVEFILEYSDVLITGFCQSVKSGNIKRE